MLSLAALLRLHNLTSEIEYLIVHIGQANDDLYISLSINHTKFKKAVTKIRY
jgi:hypothetical protein